MGKVRQKRSRRSRYNPLKRVENSDDSLSGTNSREKVVNESLVGLRNITEKILSSVVEEKIVGLDTLAAVASENDSWQPILDSNLVATVSALLSSPHEHVCLSAVGSLRNLSASGLEDVIESMLQQDVFPSLANLLLGYRDSRPPTENGITASELSTSEDDLSLQIFIQALHLLWNLCECSEEAVEMFNHRGLSTVLLRHLDPTVWGHEVALAVAECLLCVSENNDCVASDIIPTADSLVFFLSPLSASAVDLHFAITVGGLLLNINYCTSKDNSYQLLRLLDAVLEKNVLSLLSQKTNLLYSQGSNGISSAAGESNVLWDDLDHLISAQQLAVEILSNFCCPEDEDDLEYEEVVVSEEADECLEADGNFTDGSFLLPEVVEGIKHFQLVNKVLDKLSYPDAVVCDAFEKSKSGKHILYKLAALRVHILLCLQNMVPALDLPDLGGSSIMYSTWVNLGKLSFADSETDERLLEAATGSMRAIMGKLCETECSDLASITSEHLKAIFEAGVTCPVHRVRANLARMVGMLGCMMVKQNSEEDLCSGSVGKVLGVASEYLLRVAGHDEMLWVSAEALDVIIDLYSDDRTDRLSHNIHLVETLKGIQPRFKAKFNQERKNLGEHRPVVMTVRDNLVAFIKYKGPRANRYVNK